MSEKSKSISEGAGSVTTSDSKSLARFARYILVGGFNTAFGYGAFVALTWLFRGMGRNSYMYAAVSNFLAISAAFLGHKWFVFRTRGNYLVEWLRCFMVYGGNTLIGLAVLPSRFAAARSAA